MHKVFVYGTLRVGEGNWRWLLKEKAGAFHIGSDIIEGFTMINLGAFPALIENKTVPEELQNEVIIGDVFEVNDERLEALDRLEGYPDFYDRVEVETQNNGKCWVYYHNNVTGKELDSYLDRVISSGDWLNSSMKKEVEIIW